MRTFITALLVLLVAMPSVAANFEEERAKLRRIGRIFEESVAQRDLKKFQAELAPEFVGTLVDNRVVNRESITEFWDWAWGLIGPKGQWTVQVLPEPAHTKFFGDIAVTHGSAKDHIITEKGGEWRFTWNWTAIFKKTDDGWKLVAGHGSMDPLNNVFVKAEARWIKMLFGGGGALLGLVVGSAAIVLLRRRRWRA